MHFSNEMLVLLDFAFTVKKKKEKRKFLCKSGMRKRKKKVQDIELNQ